jgi:hypothetical protein
MRAAAAVTRQRAFAPRAAIASLAVIASLAAGLVPLASAAPAAVPKRIELTLEVVAKGLTVGEGRDVFEHDGRRYSVMTEARTVGIARLFKKLDEKRESRGAITADGLRPSTFRQERNGQPPNSATFDWDKGTLLLDEGGDRETVPLAPNTWDQTSLAYAFVFAEPPKASPFAVHVTDGRRVVDYDLALVGREKLETPMGSLDTLHFRKVLAGDDRRGFEFWIAPAWHRLPVRIRIVEKDGTAIDSRVTRIDIGPATP